MLLLSCSFENKKGSNVRKKIKYFLLMCLLPLLCKGQIIKNYEELENGIKINLTNGTLSISPIAGIEFTLYEDKNDNYNYEKRKYSTITFKWDDTKTTLTIGDR